MGLGVLKSSSEQVPLLIALCLHQFFEGIGLASLIKNAHTDNKCVTRLFGTVFVLATSVGVLIGWAVVASSASQSEMTEGVLNGVASGILVHTALVSMLGTELKHSRMDVMSEVEKMSVCAGLLTGGALLSVIAFWA